MKKRTLLPSITISLVLSGLLLASNVQAQVSGSITLQSGTYISDVGGSGELVSPYPATVDFGSLVNVPVYLTCLAKNHTSYIGTTYSGIFNTDFASYTQADIETSYLLDTYLKNTTPITVDHAIDEKIKKR